MLELLLLGLVVAIVLVVLYFVLAYNSLITLRTRIDNSWSQIDVQLKKRYDLIPNLVETVKGAANFEKSTLTAVVDARSRVGSFTVDKSILNDPEQFKKFQQAQGELGQSLSRLMAVMENYPQIKATENFRSLQDQLEGTENRIAVARRDFNDAARLYNTAIRRMPASIVAGYGHFLPRPYFEAEATAQKAPQVKF